MSKSKKATAEKNEKSETTVTVDIDGLDLSDLPETLQKKVQEKLAKAQENMEKRIAKRIEAMVEKQTAKVEFEELVKDLRVELDANMATIKELRERNKFIRSQMKEKRDEWKSR